jgi:hypothetical protein
MSETQRSLRHAGLILMAIGFSMIGPQSFTAYLSGICIGLSFLLCKKP